MTQVNRAKCYLVTRYRCHKAKQPTNCTARLVLKDNSFILVGDHSPFHGNDKVHIENLKLRNTVKERCHQEAGPIKDIFDQEVARYV